MSKADLPCQNSPEVFGIGPATVLGGFRNGGWRASARLMRLQLTESLPRRVFLLRMLALKSTEKSPPFYHPAETRRAASHQARECARFFERDEAHESSSDFAKISGSRMNFRNSSP